MIPTTDTPSSPTDASAGVVDQAWRIHAVQAEMTRAVDAKASIALAIESAALAGVLSLATTNGALTGFTAAAQVVLWAGVAALVAGAVAVGAVVRPRLRARAAGGNDYVFFGVLRTWAARDLVNELAGPDLVDVLARQAIAMAQICWRKHRLLQHSLTLTATGIALVAAATLLTHLTPG